MILPIPKDGSITLGVISSTCNVVLTDLTSTISFVKVIFLSLSKDNSYDLKSKGDNQATANTILANKKSENYPVSDKTFCNCNCLSVPKLANLS